MSFFHNCAKNVQLNIHIQPYVVITWWLFGFVYAWVCLLQFLFVFVCKFFSSISTLALSFGLVHFFAPLNFMVLVWLWRCLFILRFWYSDTNKSTYKAHTLGVCERTYVWVCGTKFSISDLMLNAKKSFCFLELRQG